MAFDEAKFRASAKAAGYSDEEIDAEVKGASAPVGAAPAPSMDEQFAEKERKLKEEYDQKVKDATTSEVKFGDYKFEVPSFFTSPAGIVTGAAAAIGAGSALYGSSKIAPAVYQTIKDRWINKVPEIDRTIDIPMDAKPAPVATQAAAELAAPAGTAAPDRLQRAAEMIEANRQAGLGGQPMVPVAPVEAPKAPVAPVSAAPISTPLSAAPVGAPAPTPTAGPNSFATTAVVDEITDLIQKTPDSITGVAGQPAPQPVAPPQELRTGTGKPAFAGLGPEAALNKKGEPKLKVDYASVADVPSGYAFVPGAQYIDTPRQNIGQAEYTKAYTNRPFPTTNDLAIQESKEINKLLGRATRAENIAAGLPPAELTPGITKKTSAGTKPVRVAGTLGALMAISDLAKAETPGQRGMAGANLLEAILPPGFAMSGAGEGSSTVPNVDAAMLLGSPYAQSEIAKKRRQEEEYTRKVGAGRGIAPPSAYMR